MRRDRIIAVDPGGETGAFVVEPDGRWSWSSFTNRHQFEVWITEHADTEFPITLLVEDWTPDKGAKTNQRDAWLIIGWLEGFAYINGLQLIYQKPGDRLWSDSGKMRAAGIYVPNEHARQAARHLVRFAAVTPRDTYTALWTIQNKLYDYLKTSA